MSVLGFMFLMLILGARMSYRDTRDTHAGLVECCNRDCNQGRACPVRQACELPLFADSPRASGAIALALVVACVVVALLLAKVW